MFRSVATPLLVLSMITAAGCTEDVEDGFHDFDASIEYTDGATTRSSDGRFEVTLFSEDGDVAPGENQLYVRVAMTNPDDDLDEGVGVSSAEIAVDVNCSTESDSRQDPTITSEGDGVYAINPVVLGSGACEVSFDVAFGETIHDRVTFGFTVEQ
jgi:hypothetical protein